MNKLFYLFPLLALASSCATQNTVRYTVASKTVDCTGVVPQKCLLVKKGDATEWTYFYSPIEGFTYEEGYEYVLDVKETKLENTPMDKSSIKYQLAKQVAKEARASENLPAAASATVKEYQWGGRVLSVEEENIGRGAAAGKIKVTVVKLQVTHSSTDVVKAGDVVYCELIALPKATPVVGREYIFKAKNVHPAHAKGVYFLETDVLDLVV